MAPPVVMLICKIGMRKATSARRWNNSCTAAAKNAVITSLKGRISKIRALRIQLPVDRENSTGNRFVMIDDVLTESCKGITKLVTIPEIGHKPVQCLLGYGGRLRK